MNHLTKVKLVHFICLLIVLSGHSFQIGHEAESSDAFDLDNEELDVSMNTCAASFDSEDAIAAGETVSFEDNIISYNLYACCQCSGSAV